MGVGGVCLTPWAVVAAVKDKGSWASCPLYRLNAGDGAADAARDSKRTRGRRHMRADTTGIQLKCCVTMRCGRDASQLIASR